MSSVPANATTGFVCQEAFTANNTSTCLRYTKLKTCVKDGNDSHLTFHCVGENTISIGGSSIPPPSSNMTVYNCTMESCPTAAPVKAKKAKKGKGNSASASASTSQAVKNKDKKLTLSALLILALIVLM